LIIIAAYAPNSGHQLSNFCLWLSLKPVRGFGVLLRPMRENLSYKRLTKIVSF
jgi:hypothetical protein